MEDGGAACPAPWKRSVDAALVDAAVHPRLRQQAAVGGAVGGADGDAEALWAKYFDARQDVALADGSVRRGALGPSAGADCSANGRWLMTAADLPGVQRGQRGPARRAAARRWLHGHDLVPRDGESRARRGGGWWPRLTEAACGRRCSSSSSRSTRSTSEGTVGAPGY